MASIKMQKDPCFNEVQGERYYGVGGFVLEIIKIFILALVIILPIRVFLFQPFFVQGVSMEPNFENNQYLIVNEFGYKKTDVPRYLFTGDNLFTINPFKELKRQEVVVFKYPKNPSQFFIKRTIGLPGEKVEIKDGKVMIFNDENPNGFLLDESAYLLENTKTSGNISKKLKNDEYFVMGDNRMFSSDSRSWGAVSEADIVGRALFRAWPLDKISIF